MDIPLMMMAPLAKMNTIYENAVGRWITAEEYKEITGEDYTA